MNLSNKYCARTIHSDDITPGMKLIVTESYYGFTLQAGEIVVVLEDNYIVKTNCRTCDHVKTCDYYTGPFMFKKFGQEDLGAYVPCYGKFMTLDGRRVVR